MGRFRKDSGGTGISKGSQVDPEVLRAALNKTDGSGQKPRIKIRIISGSMSPFLPTGAMAEIEACSVDDLRFLDIIVFNYKSQLTCHCFFAHGEFSMPSGERAIVTRGIASRNYDLPIGVSQLVGRVVTHRISPWQFFVYRTSNRLLGVWITEKLFGKSAKE